MQPNLTLIDMAVAFAPPLAAAETVAGEGDRAAIMRRGSLIFVRVKVAANSHRRAAVAADAKNVRAHLEATRGEINPTAVSRPGVESIWGVVKGQPFQIARVEREQIDIAVAGARGDKGKLASIG